MDMRNGGKIVFFFQYWKILVQFIPREKVYVGRLELIENVFPVWCDKRQVVSLVITLRF